MRRSRAIDGPCQRPLRTECGYTEGRQPDADSLWLRLWVRLQAMLRRAVRSAHDAEDIAAETLRRALVRFPSWPSWEDVWNWAACVAQNLVVSHWRRSGRVCYLAANVIDESAARPKPSGAVGPTTGRFIFELRRNLGPSDRPTLDLLAAGITDNAMIATLRGVTRRAIEISRQRIRVSASDLRNLCRPFRTPAF